MTYSLEWKLDDEIAMAGAALRASANTEGGDQDWLIYIARERIERAEALIVERDKQSAE